MEKEKKEKNDFATSYSDQLFKVLAQNSNKRLSDYRTSRELPSQRIPGRLAFFLDDLLENSKEKMNLSTKDVLTQILELGLVEFYKKVPADIQQNLSLPSVEMWEECSTQLKAAQHEIATLYKKHESLKTEYQSAVRKKNSLKIELDKLREENGADDPSPAHAQMRADAFAVSQGAIGYTPMTLHSLSGNVNGNTKRDETGRGHSRNNNNGRRRNNNNNNGGRYRRR